MYSNETPPNDTKTIYTGPIILKASESGELGKNR